MAAPERLNGREITQESICLELGFDLRAEMIARKNKGVRLTDNNRLRRADHDFSLSFPFLSVVSGDIDAKNIWIAELFSDSPDDFGGSKLSLVKNRMTNKGHYSLLDNKVIYELDMEQQRIVYFGNLYEDVGVGLRFPGLGLLGLFRAGEATIPNPRPEKTFQPSNDEILQLRIILEDGLTGAKNASNRQANNKKRFKFARLK